jgi:hypothetical protein
VLPSREEFTVSLSLPIPKWSFVGLGKVYANVYTSVPSAGGVALGPGFQPRLLSNPNVSTFLNLVKKLKLKKSFFIKN